MGVNLRRPADAVGAATGRAQPGEIEDIPPVENDSRPGHQPVDFRKIERRELVPLGQHRQSMRAAFMSTTITWMSGVLRAIYGLRGDHRRNRHRCSRFSCRYATNVRIAAANPWRILPLPGWPTHPSPLPFTHPSPMPTESD